MNPWHDLEQFMTSSKPHEIKSRIALGYSGIYGHKGLGLLWYYTDGPDEREFDGFWVNYSEWTLAIVTPFGDFRFHFRVKDKEFVDGKIQKETSSN